MEKRKLYRFQKERKLSLMLLDFIIIVRAWMSSPRCLALFFFFSQNQTLKNALSARYWKDPYTFNPSRFLAADWPRDAFMAFNSGEKWEPFFGMTFFYSYEICEGPRGCIGRKYTFFSNQKASSDDQLSFFLPLIDSPRLKP